MAGGNYRTRQKDILLSYIKTLSGVHFTAADVNEYFKAQGAKIGQSTIYRQLERLVDEGLVKKYTIDLNSPACFEYIGEGEHADPEVCFHCKCEKCGKLIHLHCDELKEIQTHMYAEHQFKMNPVRTVFYGLCDECI